MWEWASGEGLQATVAAVAPPAAPPSSWAEGGAWGEGGGSESGCKRCGRGGRGVGSAPVGSAAEKAFLPLEWHLPLPRPTIGGGRPARAGALGELATSCFQAFPQLGTAAQSPHMPAGTTRHAPRLSACLRRPGSATGAGRHSCWRRPLCPCQASAAGLPAPQPCLSELMIMTKPSRRTVVNEARPLPAAPAGAGRSSAGVQAPQEAPPLHPPPAHAPRLLPRLARGSPSTQRWARSLLRALRALSGRTRSTVCRAFSLPHCPLPLSLLLSK